MEVLKRSKLFGTRRRTEVMLLLHLLRESHASELAKLLRAGLLPVQRILNALEDENIVTGRTVGRERRYSFNPRFSASRELSKLLSVLAERDVEVRTAAASIRRRPRKRGKAL